MATLDTEIRKLQPADLHELGHILNQSDSWKKLMAIVPKENDESQFMFNADHVKMIEQGMRQLKRGGGEVFLSEWSTMGRKQPTCQTMLDLLVKAELFRAADYLAVNVLKRDRPERPKSGPGAAIDVSDKMLEDLLKQQAQISPRQPEPESWSLHYRENPGNAECVGVQLEENAEKSDLMKFTQEQSDLMKFSKDASVDLMKFSTSTDEKSNDDDDDDDYVLRAVRSEDLPVFVRFNGDAMPPYPGPRSSNGTSSISNSELYSTDSALSTDSDVTEHYSDSTIASEYGRSSQQQRANSPSQSGDAYVPEVDGPKLPNIPVVVLEYNARARLHKNDSNDRL